MQMNRRALMMSSAGIVLTAAIRSVAAESTQHAPAAAALQSGDMLWPKKPGAFVPYELNADGDADADRARWIKERDEFVKQANASSDVESRAAANELRGISYNDFRAIYLRGEQPNTITPYGLGGIVAVGHVAIVDVDSTGVPWVIEALLKSGVVRSQYAAWLSGRPGEIVWQGRLKGITESARTKIAVEAVKWLGTPYDFWNFNLDDTRGFYCSKLVWHSVKVATGIAIDGNQNPRRHLWISPKQELYAPTIERVYDPGEYAIE